MKRRTVLTLPLGLLGLPVPAEAATGQAALEARRRRFVEERLGFIEDKRVKHAFLKVRREAYCLPTYRDRAYEDRPLPIGLGQTISQPSLVAYMTEALNIEHDEKVLEIGTGSGFQVAILAEMTPHVYTIELLPELADRARATLRAEGYERVNVRTGDGYLGWPEEAPFDAIIVTAAPSTAPPALLEQLRPGTGRLLLPEGPQGPEGQVLTIYRKRASGELDVESLLAVRFVPMVHGKPEQQ